MDEAIDAMLVELTSEDLRRRFTYHPPTPDKPPIFERLRKIALLMAGQIAHSVPPGRERDLALQKLEETVMWANAGVARPEAKELVAMTDDEVEALPDI